MHACCTPRPCATFPLPLQVTALGNPKLLERVSSGLVAIRNLFSQFDTDMNNVITREEFKAVRPCAHWALLGGPEAPCACQRCRLDTWLMLLPGQQVPM